MQIYYGQIEEEPNYVAWVQCDREDLDDVREVFPTEEYELTVGVKPNYDPITCSVETLNNPPASTWGVDVWKRELNGRCEGLSPNKDSR